MSDLDHEIFDNLLVEAQEFVDEGNLEGALEFYKEADTMFPSEHVQTTIFELEAKVEEENALISKFEEKIKQRESMGAVGGAYGTPGEMSSVPPHMRSFGNQSMLDQTVDISMRSLNRSFDVNTYNSLIVQARTLYQKQELSEALELYTEANDLNHNVKLQRRIDKIKQQLKRDKRRSSPKVKSPESEPAKPEDYEEDDSGEDAEESEEGSDEEESDPGENDITIPIVVENSQPIPESEDEEPLDVEHYNACLIDAKRSLQDGDFMEALRLYREAQTLHHDPKILRRINTIKERFPVGEQEEEICPETQDIPEVGELPEVRDIPEALANLKLNKQTVDEPTGQDRVNFESGSETESIGDEVKEYYNSLIVEAKGLIKSKTLEKAIDVLKEANGLIPNDKIAAKIIKLQSEIDAKDTIAADELDPEAYNNIILAARSLYKANDLQGALHRYQEAFEMAPGDKLQDKINKVKEMIQAQDERKESDEEGKEEEVDVERYNRLVLEAREQLNAENVPQALKLYNEAMDMNPSEKLQKRIDKVIKMLPEQQEEDLESEGEEPTRDNEDQSESEESDSEDVDEEMKEFYNSLILDAKEKIKGKKLAEAIDALKEANELIPSDKVAAKIAKLQFEVDSAEEEKGVPSSEKELKPAEKKEYNELVSKGKAAQRSSKIEKALDYYQKAVAIYQNEKLATRITKLKAYLEEEQNDDWYTDMGDGFFLTNEVHEKLYPYQREGVKWMWDLYKSKQGGILGDDMGLGKTIQTIAFVQAMFNMELISTVMLVMPLSLINNWQSEFEKWAPEIRVELFHGPKHERERNIRKVIKRGGVTLSTYGIIEKNVDFLEETGCKWDYLILDEGHKIKNPTKTSKSVRKVSCSHRLLISDPGRYWVVVTLITLGTPIQNNLKELWALFDFVSRGKLLGTMTTFKMHYITPIERGREKDASKGEGKLGTKLAENLRALIDPCFLRRTKAGVKKMQSGDSKSGINKLSKKNEICVWLKLSKQQENLYKAFITLDTVKEAMNQTKSPLAALTVLKKICDHPRLAIKFEALREITKDNEENELVNNPSSDLDQLDKKELLNSLHLPDNPDDDLLIAESCKLKFAIDLLENLCQEGHRTLFFSMSRKILDYVQSMISAKGMLCCRIDGTISKPSERQQIIETFDTDMKYKIFLLTTQVGGVGLNLTSADRVIIYDPSWNPATDAQAVDRSYRIGQLKPVTVYRLLTNGTIEEKIYRKQVFKDSITRQATGDSFDPIRYFTNSQLRELFKLDDTSYSGTCQHLEQLHASERAYTDLVKQDIATLITMGRCCVETAKNVLRQEASGQIHANDPKNFATALGQGPGTAHRSKPGPAPRNKQEIPHTYPNNHHHPNEPQQYRDPRPQYHTHDPRAQENKFGPEFNAFEFTDERPAPVLPAHTAPVKQTSPYLNNTHHSTPTKEVINIDDDDDVQTEANRKLSLSAYKRRQMSMYDFAEPSPIPSIAQSKLVTGYNDLPAVYSESPVKQIIQNHLNNTPKKVHVIESDEEEAEDLDSSKYDNLNKPECLNDEEEFHDAHGDLRSDARGDAGLTDIMRKISFGGQKENAAPTNSVREEEREETREEKRESLKEVMTNKVATPKRRSMGIKMHTPRKLQDLHQGYKENSAPKEKNKTGNPDCQCGGFESALSQGYKVTKCKCMCSDEDLNKYNQYLERGLEHHKTENLGKALAYYKKALQFRNDDVTVQKAYISCKKKLASH